MNVHYKSKLMSAFIFALSIAIPQLSMATIIDHGDYLSDTESGLDWLDLTATEYLPYVLVSNNFGEDELFEGWRYATGDQFASLADHFGGVGPYEIQNAWNPSNQVVVQNMLSLMGILHPTTGSEWDANFSFGILADSASSSTFWNGLLMEDGQVGTILVHDRPTIYSSPYAYTGSFLVRDTSVPEPSSLLLMGIGLAGLGFVRLRKRS